MDNRRQQIPAHSADKNSIPRIPHAGSEDQFGLPVLQTVRVALGRFLHGRSESLRLLAEEPGRLEQTRFSTLTREYFAIAMDYYALGYPLPDVRDGFASSAFASLKKFERRGTESAFHVVNFVYDPRFEPTDPRAVVKLEPASPPGTKDFSLTNSKANFRAVNTALLSGEFGIASKLAALAWDPPDAKYIGHGRYSSCTAEDQHLAYAMQDFFAGDAVGCNENLAKIRIHPKHDAFIAQANMVRGLASDNRDAFLEGLVRMLEWHAPEARRKTNRTNPEFFLCVPAMGLTSLAIRRNLLSISALPDIANEENYFSRELIELAQASATERVELEFRSFKTNDEQSQARSEGGR